MADKKDSAPGEAMDALATVRIDRSSTAERVADSLRQLILHGDLKPGQPLREMALSETIDVSRNTIREAFRLLGREGLVVHHIHRGVLVKELTEDEVHDIYTTRQALELCAIEHSANRSEAELQAIGDAIEEASQALERGDWKTVATADLAFHQRLVALLHSRRIDAFFQAVLAELRLAFAIVEDQEAFLPPFHVWNKHLYGLLNSGERERCAREMEQYLAEAERVIIEILRGDGPIDVRVPSAAASRR
jgi:DNA-binding GntR family transcriptional regulator